MSVESLVNKLKLEELEVTMGDIKKEIEKLKENMLKENKEKWIPVIGEKFYYVDSNGHEIETTNYNTLSDNFILKNSKVFNTKKQAEEYKRFLSELNNYSTEFTDEEWKNNELLKYYISYSYYEKKVLVSSSCCMRNDVPVFTEKNIYEFIDKYKKQIKKYMFDVEE